ncbi:MAG: YqaA family protein [Agrobacterium vaccinii]
MLEIVTYVGLFVTSMVSASLVPLHSEVALVGLIFTERFSTVGLILTASLGNTAGGVLNWLIGRGIETFRNRRWFPLHERQLNRASGWYGKYGKWSLLLAWVPIAGDGLTVLAGVMKEPLVPFLVLVFIAKLMRCVGTVLLAAYVLV